MRKIWIRTAFLFLAGLIAIMSVAGSAEAARGKPVEASNSYFLTDGFHDFFYYPDVPSVSMAGMNYDLVSEGTYRRQDGAFVADAPGWVTISGSCSLKAREVTTAILYTDDNQYNLFSSSEQVIPFIMTVYSGRLEVVMFNRSGATVAIGCSLMIEPQ